MSEAWPNSREASKSVAFTSSTVAPVEEREAGMKGGRQKESYNSWSGRKKEKKVN